ncbi:methyltransferase domain-containing protein [Eubacteriales bacterium OttesenSCG-928-A19]|nr:methyltransferase domain-containing protein [Eubacteriales bacterium OttesenSCG-928-A19]
MIDEILQYTNLQDAGREIQRNQTKHRMKLADIWGIPEGARVLEIGCGQGDTTAVLAHLVGENGFVHGIDIASADYGAPLTLGQATEQLLQSRIGGRLQIDLNTDFLSDTFKPDVMYDCFVMSHCSWYFSSIDEVINVLKKARQMAKKLCFAEWDVRLRLPEQSAHFFSVLIQAQCACFAPIPDSNIRTLLTPEDTMSAARQAGWRIVNTATVFSPDLQDGKWETEFLLSEYPGILSTLDTMPEKLKSMLLSFVAMVGTQHDIEAMPLNTCVFSADA